jgi:Integrase core domain
MELTMATRKEITRAQAVKYQAGSRDVKSDTLDVLCEMTGLHRDYVRRVLRAALLPQVVAARTPRAPKYAANVVAALEKCWAVLNAPAGKRLAPMLPELVFLLRKHHELIIDDTTATLLIGMSPATIDRRLVAAKSKLLPRGRSHTKPGSMLKSRIAMRTWADHDENTPGFVEIDLVAHEGGNSGGRFCFTLTVTDIATGWTENRTVIGKAQAQVFTALTDVVEHLPFPIKGIDSDNGSEFINEQLLRYCQGKQLKFTRSRSGNSNDGAHVEQKNWTTVRQLVGYLRYDTEAELLLLNQIWAMQSLIGNHFYPQQKLISKVRDGAKVTKKYDPAQTPYARTTAHPGVEAPPKSRLKTQHASFNPAAVQRQIQELCAELLTVATAKGQPPTKPTITDATNCAGHDNRPTPTHAERSSRSSLKPAAGGRQAPPPRGDIATTVACPVCATGFTPIRRQRYCSPACRQAAWRARHQGPAPEPAILVAPHTSRRDITIYQCPECDTRQLGQQWCHDCNKPCIRVDLGGLCPECDEPVTISDITDQHAPSTAGN